MMNWEMGIDIHTIMNKILDQEMAAHSSILGNPMDRGVWQASSWGHKRVRHDLATKQ